MADKVTVRLSSAAAAFVKGEVPKPEKLRAARGEVSLCASDLGNVLLFLSLDADVEVKTAAVSSLRGMPYDLQVTMAQSPGTHPKVIELLARFHPSNANQLLSLQSTPALGELDAPPSPIPASPAGAGPEEPLDEDDEEQLDECGGNDDQPAEENDEPVNEEAEEFLSKYKLCMQLDTAEKIKYALTGDKEWRTILIKESNKLVSSAVIKNPRITEAEILTIAKSKIQNDDILRLICMNKEWLKQYRIRKALVENTKTPLPKALRFMSTLTEKDLAGLARSKNVPTVISTQARRLLFAKKK